MINIKNKKAELTSEQIIKVSILVLSFLIILGFWIFFSWKGEINSETCHTSVILKKTLPDKPIIVGGGKIAETPLKCKTNKICLKKGLFDPGCANLGSDYEKISISSEEDIIKNIADSMASCWSMMGESKGSMVFSREFSTGYTSRGVICDIIDFSSNVKSEFPTISSAKLNYYLNTNKIPGKEITYGQYLSNSQNPTVLISDDVLTDKKLSTKDPLATIFVEYEKGFFATWFAGAAGTVAIGAIYGSIIPGAGTLVGAGVGLIVSVAGGILVGEAEKTFEDYTTKNPAKYFSSLYLTQYNPRKLTELNIGSFENLA